jgi:hypothetical protein
MTDRPFCPHVEADLLVALARSGEVHLVEVDPLLQHDIDWHAFIQLAITHNVVPLIYHHLKTTFASRVPASALHDLRRVYLRLFRESIQIRGELPHLLNYLNGHGIAALPFKGPLLAAVAYADENLRTFTDLDLLIHESDVERTVRALEEAGFAEKNPLQPDHAATWTSYAPWNHPHGNANGYVRDSGTPGALHVDIHWGLASRYFLFPMEPDALWKRREPVTLDNGATVDTFSPEDTLLFQCMHAAKDGYYRLSHVCDIAELLRSHPHLDAAAVLERARAVHCERMVGLGLRVSHDLLDAPLPKGVQSRVVDDPALGRLSRGVQAALFRYRHGVPLLLHRARFHLLVRDRARDGLGAVYHTFRTSLQSAF